MNKIMLGSDLHLEYSHIKINNNDNCDILILAGDICQISNIDHEFFNHISQQFNHVIMVMGNHEFYNGDFYDSICILKHALSRYQNITLLENDMITINGVHYIGATLWTDCNNKDPITMLQLPKKIGDYNSISKLTPHESVNRHIETLEYIKSTVNQLPQSDKIVVITHHAPSELSIKPEYKFKYVENGGFATELGNYITNSNIAMWAFGHVHHVHRYYIGDTLLVCNPRGYVFNYCENNWEPKIVDLDNMPVKNLVESDYNWIQ